MKKEIILCNSMTDAFYKTANYIVTNGVYSSSGALNYLEVYPLALTVSNPLNRCYVIPNRYNCIFSTIAETMWVLAGRDDIDFLEFYLKRAKDFSDDGATWRGAYGPRIFDWNGINQFKECIHALRENPKTTRACIAIFDPERDHNIAKKDIPCNNWIQFYIKDDLLHMNVSLRANDLVWGFSGINFFEWSTLQELAAYWLKIGIGSYNHFVGNMVIFDRHFDRIKRILNNVSQDDIYKNIDKIKRISIDIKEENYKIEFQKFFLIEKMIRNDQLTLKDYLEKKTTINSEYLKYCLDMLTSYNYYKKNNYKNLCELWDTLELSDFKLCGTEYFLRKKKGDRESRLKKKMIKITDSEILDYLSESC